MSKVLVHLSSTNGPLGVWREKGESLESFYPGDASQWKKRAQKILDGKLESVSYEAFFGRLNDSSPYSDQFMTLDAEDDEPLTSVMYRALRETSS